MKKILLLSIFLCSIFAISIPVHSAFTPSSLKEMIPSEDGLKKISIMKIKDIQKLIGRKLSLKEKISFFILRHQLKHKPAEKTNQGKTAQLLGIFAVSLLLIGVFAPYVFIGSLACAIPAVVVGTIAKKQNPSDKKAQAGLLMGWITIGLFALVLIIAAIALSSWSWD